MRSDHNQHLGILRGIVSLPEEIADSAGKIRKAREAGESTSLLIVEQAADDCGHFFFNAHSLRNSPVGDDRDAIDAGAGESANLELQLQCYVVIRMKGGSGLDLNADIFIFRAGIGLLRDLTLTDLKTGSLGSGLR